MNIPCMGEGYGLRYLQGADKGGWMIRQINLFEAEREKQKAIDDIESRNVGFHDAMLRRLVLVARQRKELNALDLWSGYKGDQPSHPRAIGTVFRAAVKIGIIEWTGKLIKSGRRTDHNQDLKIWRSLINLNDLAEPGTFG